jgi:hypothetical protein
VADDLAARILQQLASSGPLSAIKLYARLYPEPTYTTFQQETEKLGAIQRTLATLKSQHRAWCENGDWRITARGRTT